MRADGVYYYVVTNLLNFYMDQIGLGCRVLTVHGTDSPTC